jgi:hypothetical protein
MYFTHHFAHHETLSLAHSWLTRLGFKPRKIATETSGIPRIVLNVEPQRLDAVCLLISAAERNDPDGFPSFWDEARQSRITPKDQDHEGTPPERRRRQSTVIGWHPLD